VISGTLIKGVKSQRWINTEVFYAHDEYDLNWLVVAKTQPQHCCDIPLGQGLSIEEPNKL